MFGRMAARLPPVHEPAVKHLDMVESATLRCLHHPPGRAGGRRPAASRVGGTALVKLAVIGTLACTTWRILADPLVPAPGLRRIV